MKKHILIFPLVFFSLLVYSQGVSQLQQRKISNAISAISGLYVDTINDKKLVETAIEAMLKQLDPHSSYISKAEEHRLNAPVEPRSAGAALHPPLPEDP